MHVWTISLLCTAVCGISRISQPGLKAVNFARAIEGWKLNGSVISEKEVDSEGSCRYECVQDERCKSFNFGSKNNNTGRHMCQLSDSDRFVGRVNFTVAAEFRYRGIKVITNKLTWLTNDKLNNGFEILGIGTALKWEDFFEIFIRDLSLCCSYSKQHSDFPMDKTIGNPRKGRQ